jgi:PLP dependent protein
MLTPPQFLAVNLTTVRQRMSLAAAHAGRDPQSVRLIAVSKGQPTEAIVAAAAAGVTDFGENYLQEALAKIAEVPRTGLTWHFIGQLQSNKTRPVAEQFDWVHTVAEAGPLNICLQVKLADEAAKGGIAPDDLPALAHALQSLPRLQLRGLMCVPPASDDPAVERSHFAHLRRLAEALRREGIPLDTLSMGMSDDLESAILEGATHIRIGTAIFGPRNLHAPHA